MIKGGIDVSYISDISFDQIDDEYTTKCTLGTRFVTWCIFNLYIYVTLGSTCHIMNLANDTIHLEIKMTP